MTKKTEEVARRMTVDAATSVEDDDLSYFVGLESAVVHEIEALFTALVLYRRAFTTDLHPECGPSSTPPPSLTLTTRSVKYAWMLLKPRKALGNRVFEDNNTDVEGEVEVDMVLRVFWDWMM